MKQDSFPPAGMEVLCGGGSRLKGDFTMKICICDHCRYIFAGPVIPDRCPDCGAEAVRPAAGKETAQYRRFREIIWEEIRLGVIPG